MKRKKVRVITAGIIGIMLLAAVAGTYAFLNATTNVKENLFSPKKIVNITVLEQDPASGRDRQETGEKTPQNYAAIQGGATVPKKVWIENYDNPEGKVTDAYIRVRLVPRIVFDSDNAGTGISLEGQISYNFAASGPGTADSGWQQQGDYFYYKTPVAPGDTTTQLLESVLLAPGFVMPKGCHLEIQVLADALDAADLGAVKDTWGADIPIQ